MCTPHISVAIIEYELHMIEAAFEWSPHKPSFGNSRGVSGGWSGTQNMLSPIEGSLGLSKGSGPKPPKTLYMMPKNQLDHARDCFSMSYIWRGFVFMNLLLVPLVHRLDYNGKVYVESFLTTKILLIYDVKFLSRINKKTQSNVSDNFRYHRGLNVTD